jgi:beta-lactamase regulating signal transducer with metallopeptidase domain
MIAPAVAGSFTGAAVFVSKSLLLLALGWSAARLLARAPAAVRHTVWLTTIVGVLLVPVLDRITALPLRVLPAALVNVTVTPWAPTAMASASTPSQVASMESRPAPPIARLSAAQALFAVWAAIALILLVRLVASIAAVSRLTSRSRALALPDWTNALAEAARRLRVNELPRLVISDEVELPFAFNAFSPAIVLPASAREWSADRRRSVLLHELAHIRRRDLAGQTIAGLACALNWFNPVMWVAARQLRVESELASDEIVLSAGVRPSVYAQHLLDMVTTFGRSTPNIALAMARPREFEGRLVAILDTRRRRSLYARSRSVIVAAIIALSAVAIGAIAPEPRSAPTQYHALSSAAVASLQRYGTSGIINPMLMLLRAADSMGLSAPQTDSIATLNRRYMIRLSAIWRPISALYASQSDGGDEQYAAAGADAQRETTRALVEILAHVERLLTPEQRQRAPGHVARYLRPNNVEAYVTGAPDGVFVPSEQLYLLRGRGRGGG